VPRGEERVAELYDAIGRGYRELRRPDPRIGAAILAALGDARSVLNVGAGAGSYEPRDRRVVAVEPSLTMIRQRARGAAPVVRGLAEALPVRDASFDASLATLTIHHWPDRRRGLEELRRAARRRVVILTWDHAAEGFWLAD
jgi:SAM-dependent methyltransferase